MTPPPVPSPAEPASGAAAAGPAVGTAPIRVLLVEDSEIDAAHAKVLFRRITARPHHVEWRTTPAEALAEARTGTYDVGLFDQYLGHETGLDLLRQLRHEGIELPVILFTGLGLDELDQAALAAGASDYLSKLELDPTRLERSIRYAVNHARTLAELRASQAQLQLFMRSVPCAVCIHDAAGEVLFQNEIFARDFSVADVQAASARHPAASAVPLQLGDRHWLATRFPMVDRAGRHLSGIAAIDVTQRVEAETELRRTTEFLSGVLATLPVAVTRIDERAVIREARGQALADFAGGGDALGGRSVFDVLPGTETPIREALGGAAVNFPVTVLAGGKPKHLENYYRFDRSRGAGAMGFAIDVTARVEAERLIKQQSQLLNGLLANLPMIVGRLDPYGYVVELEGEQLAKYGITRSALVGHPLAALYPQLQPAVAAALRGGAVNSLLTAQLDGTEWFADFFIFSDRESGRGALFFGCDITQRKLIERELLRIGDAEKNRIGSDLHDGLGQCLTGISCLSAALRDRLRQEDRAEAEDAATIAGLVQEAIVQTRALARGLSPVQLETNGLEAALEDMTFHLQRLHNVECRFVGVGVCELPPPVGLHLYRIAQEALNNALKHARARRIVVTADFAAPAKVLRIEDDGCGFDPAADNGRGSGLSLMRYRAAMVGGTLAIVSQPGAGTRIACRFVTPPAQP